MLQLHEHNSVIKKIILWRRWWLSLLVASIYSLLSEFLLLCMWRFYSVRDEDQLWCKEICFLLDTTTFSTIQPSVQFSCLGSFMRGLLQSWYSVARWADSIRHLFYENSFWPYHGIFIIVGSFGCTRCHLYPILLHKYCLPRFVLCGTFRFHEMGSSQCYVHRDVALWAIRSFRHHRRYDDLCHLIDDWAVFSFGGQWHRLRLYWVLWITQASFVCFVDSCVFSGRPTVDLLSITSWEVYLSYGHLETQGLLVLTLIEELMLSMTIIEYSSQGGVLFCCAPNPNPIVSYMES